MTEEVAILSQRLDVLVAEAERLHTNLDVTGLHNEARDVFAFALELRLARRTLSTLIAALNPSNPTRPLSLVTHDRTIA